MYLTLAVLSSTIPRIVDSSGEASGQSDCFDSSGSGCSNETGYEECGDPSICGAGATQGNLPLALGLTIGAGLSTTIGALMPCIPLVKRSNKFFLSAALATAGGVMLYVSFTEIFVKAQDYLCCATPQHSYLLATISLFLGVIFTVLLEVLLKVLKRVQCTSTKRRLVTLRSRFREYSGASLQRRNGKRGSDLCVHTANPLQSPVAVDSNWESSEKEKSSKNLVVDDSTDTVQIYISSESASNSSSSNQNGIRPTISDTVLVSNGNKEGTGELAIQIFPAKDTVQEGEDESSMVGEASYGLLAPATAGFVHLCKGVCTLVWS